MKVVPVPANYQPPCTCRNFQGDHEGGCYWGGATPESKAAKLLGRKGGRKGGLSKSERKQAAARENGKKGGHPKAAKLPPDEEAYLVNAMICPHCDVNLSSNGFIRWCENGHVWSENGKKGGRPKKENAQ